jgi:Glycine zipper 2TM domain
MKTRFLVIILSASLLTGCAGMRHLLTGAAGAGAGAYAGHKLGHGRKSATIAGAAAGVVVSEGLNYLADTATESARLEGYNKGRSDAVKQQYWMSVNQQKAVEGAVQDRVSLYEIPIPEQQIDGVNLKATNKVIRIQE